MRERPIDPPEFDDVCAECEDADFDCGKDAAECREILEDQAVDFAIDTLRDIQAEERERTE